MEQRSTMSMEEARSRLLAEMYRHMGKENAISMVELYRIVFDCTVNDKINDTRPLRNLINLLKKRKGIQIASSRKRTGGGYYICRTAQELEDYCRPREYQAIRILKEVATFRRITMTNLVGQIHLRIREGGHETKDL